MLLKIFVLVLVVVLLAHIKEGVENVLQDYVHNERTKLVSFFFISCVQIELFKYMYIFLEI